MDSGVADPLTVIELHGVRFTPHEVAEVDGVQVMVRVRRPDIQSIAFRHGYHSAHPFLQVGAGAVLAAIGLLPTRHFAHWIVHGGTFIGHEAWLMTFVFLGPWLMFDALKRGPYLEVRANGGVRKVAFSRIATPEDVQRCLDAAEQVLGYSIDREAGRRQKRAG